MNTSDEKVSEIRRCGVAADEVLLPIEEYQKRSSLTAREIVQDDHKVTVTSNQSEVVNQRLYTLLAFAFGVVFLAALLYLTAGNPNPTTGQLRIWTAVLALAGGAVATVMSGLINVRLTLGKQFAVGATGALAVFVIIYFKNPAILQ